MMINARLGFHAVARCTWPPSARLSAPGTVAAVRVDRPGKSWVEAQRVGHVAGVGVAHLEGEAQLARCQRDAHVEQDHYAAVSGPIDRGECDVAIGVTHSPYHRVLDAMTRDGHDLIFTGHTHGGQICVPGYGALVTNCDLDRRRAKGLSRYLTGDREAWLHVSAGLGTSPYAPIRVACPPEATRLTLTSAA